MSTAKDQAVTRTHIQFTLFNSRDPLTKRIFQYDDGTIGKKSAALQRGTAERVEVEGAQGLAHILNNLTPHQAISYGITQRLRVNIAPRNYLAPGDISRTRDNFKWPVGPGVLFLDFDGKYNADSIPNLRQALADAMPALDSAPQVWTRSSSAAIFDPASGETSKGGLHCYVLVSEANAIPTIGKQLYDALWMIGHGQHALSKGQNPSALERCLIDDSVWQPERLDFAAAPLVRAPLLRIEATVITVVNEDAAALDPACIEPLSEDQYASISRTKKASKKRIMEQVKEARATLLETLPIAEREPQRQRWLSMDMQMLTPDTTIILGNGNIITAADIVATPALYNGQQCRDPQDPFNSSASDSQGMIFADDRGCRIFSFAHGGRTFRLVDEVPQKALQACKTTLAFAWEPDTRDITRACYQHRALVTDNGLVSAAEEVGATLEYAEQVWKNHLQDKIRPLHSDAMPTQTFSKFSDIVNLFKSLRESLLVLARLGSGKSQHLGAKIVQQAQSEGRPVLTITVLRALTWANADVFNATHYSDDSRIIDASSTVSTTLHSLSSPKLNPFLRRLKEQKGVVVIDEAAAVAELLFSRSDDSGILQNHQRHDIINILSFLARAGVQTLMLDGDGTPCANVLSQLMGCRVVACTEQQHSDPMVTVYPERTVTHERQKHVSTPCHTEIIQLLQAGERVVLPTDSREQAERLNFLYAPMATGGALCIHGKNADEPEQAAFRANPNDEAKRWQLIIYSPALSVGVSVTSVMPHIFTFVRAGSLDAAGLWQIARRFRRAADNLVRFVVAEHLCRPQRYTIGFDNIQEDITQHAYEHGYCSHAPEIHGMIAAEWQRNLYNANPLYALIGHLNNIDVMTTVVHSGDKCGIDDRKLAKEVVRIARIRRIATASHMSPSEAEKFERIALAVTEDQAKLERYRIEQALVLNPDDFGNDGSLPEKLVEDSLYNNLTKRVRRLASLLAVAQGVDLEIDHDPVPGFAYLPHENAQARLMFEILNSLTNDDNEIVVTADQARATANAFRRRIHVAYRDIPNPPKKGATNQAFTRWARDLLHSWGMLSDKCKQVGERTEARGVRMYIHKIDAHVVTFAARFHARHFAASANPKIALNPAWLQAFAGNTTKGDVYNRHAQRVASDTGSEKLDEGITNVID